MKLAMSAKMSKIKALRYFGVFDRFGKRFPS